MIWVGIVEQVLGTWEDRHPHSQSDADFCAPRAVGGIWKWGGEMRAICTAWSVLSLVENETHIRDHKTEVGNPQRC